MSSRIGPQETRRVNQKLRSSSGLTWIVTPLCRSSANQLGVFGRVGLELGVVLEFAVDFGPLDGDFLDLSRSTACMKAV